MIAGTVSKPVNNNAQVYVTSFGWTCLFPMKLKSDNHETLKLLFKCDVVPPDMIMDNSKEQLRIKFCKKLVRLTVIRRQFNPTRLGGQPLRKTSVN